MKDYIVSWNCGYGNSYETVAAKNREDAMDQAYNLWREDAENNADFNVVGEWTEELAEEYGI